MKLKGCVFITDGSWRAMCSKAITNQGSAYTSFSAEMQKEVETAALDYELKKKSENKPQNMMLGEAVILQDYIKLNNQY